jgi:glutamate-5-semialdehyde dehydrogenase
MAVLLERKNSHTRKISKISTIGGDLAMEKRLLVDDAKIDGMILLLKAISESRRSNRASSF